MNTPAAFDADGRPTPAELARMIAEDAAFASRCTTREDGDSFGPNLIPGKPDANTAR